MEPTYIVAVLLVLTSISYTDAGCVVEGVSYKEGENFRHPENDCSICRCCENGKFTCTVKECPPPKCGTKMQLKSADGCCWECKPRCEKAKCEEPDCPESEYAYHQTSCCPVCGCRLNVNGTYWPVEAVPRGHFGACGRCTCHSNDVYTCNDAVCPPEGLECINPEAKKRGKQCTFKCPDQYTCRRSNVLLKPTELTQIGYKWCTCNPYFWYPRGFCMTLKWQKKQIDILHNHRCMAMPSFEGVPVRETLTHVDYRDVFKSQCTKF